MTRLSLQEKQAFLADVHVGVLSIPRQGAAPLSSPVWYQYQPGGDLQFVAYKGTLKSRLVERGMRISFCVQDEAPPYVYVTVEGSIQDIRDSTEETLNALAVRYLGEEGAKEYANRAPDGETLAVSMTPDVWLAADFSR